MTSSGEVSATGSPAGTPSSVQAPKYGTLIPNRIFVGGIAANCCEQDLKQFFAAYGAVKDCKIIADRAGVSKGYGFVTFECQEDAEKIIKNESDNLVFKDRKLNIGPAIRKQAFPGPRMYEPSLSPGSTILYTNGVPYTFQNGMAVFHPPEGYSVPTQPQPAYPMMVGGSPVYAMNQAGSAYSYPSPGVGGTQSQWTSAAASAAAAAAAGQWRWSPQSPLPAMTASPNQYVYPASAAMALHPGELVYAQHGTQGYSATDLTDAATVQAQIEAAAQPAEGSSTVEASSQVHHRYAECTSPDHHPHSLLQHQQAGLLSKSGYPILKCHMPQMGGTALFATPPPTPSPMATPIKMMSSHALLTTSPPMMTKDRSDLDEFRRGINPMTPPVTPQPELPC